MANKIPVRQLQQTQRNAARQPMRRNGARPANANSAGQVGHGDEIEPQTPRDLRIDGLSFGNQEGLDADEPKKNPASDAQSNGEERSEKGQPRLKKQLTSRALNTAHSKSRSAGRSGQAHKPKARSSARVARLEEQLLDPESWNAELEEVVPSLLASMLGRPISLWDPESDARREIKHDLKGRALRGAPLVLSRSGLDYMAGRGAEAIEVGRGPNSFFEAIIAAENASATPARKKAGSAATTPRGPVKAGQAERSIAANKLASSTSITLRKALAKFAVANRKAVFAQLSRGPDKRSRGAGRSQEPVALRETGRSAYGDLVRGTEWQTNIRRDQLTAQVKSRIRSPKQARARLKRASGDLALLRQQLTKLEAVRPRTRANDDKIAAMRERVERLHIETSAIRSWLTAQRTAPAKAKARTSALGATPTGAIPGESSADRSQAKGRKAPGVRFEGAKGSGRRRRREARATVLQKLPEVHHDRNAQKIIDKVVEAARSLGLVPAAQALGEPVDVRPWTGKLVEDSQLMNRIEAAGLGFGPNAKQSVKLRVSPTSEASRFAVAAALVLEPRLSVEIQISRTAAKGQARTERHRRPLPPGRDPDQIQAQAGAALVSWYRGTLVASGVSEEEATRRVLAVAAAPGEKREKRAHAASVATGIVAHALAKDGTAARRAIARAWIDTIPTDVKKALDVFAENAFRGFDGAVVVMGVQPALANRRRLARATMSDFAKTQLFEIVEKRLGEKCVFLELPFRIGKQGEAGPKGTDPRHELYLLGKLRERRCILAGVSGQLLERAALVGVPALAIEPPLASNRTAPRLRDYAGRAEGWFAVEAQDAVAATSGPPRGLRRDRAALRAFVRHELTVLQNMNLVRTPDDRLSSRAKAALAELASINPASPSTRTRLVAKRLISELDKTVQVLRRTGSTKKSAIDLGRAGQIVPKTPISFYRATPEPLNRAVPPRVYLQLGKKDQGAGETLPGGVEDIDAFTRDLRGLEGALTAWRTVKKEPKLDLETMSRIEEHLRSVYSRRQALSRRLEDPRGTRAADEAQAAAARAEPDSPKGQALWSFRSFARTVGEAEAKGAVVRMPVQASREALSGAQRFGIEKPRSSGEPTTEEEKAPATAGS